MTTIPTAASLAQTQHPDPRVRADMLAVHDFYVRVERAHLAGVRQARSDDHAVRHARLALGTWSAGGDVKLTNAAPADVAEALAAYAGRAS